MVRQLVMDPLWIEPPAWLAIDPKASEESAQPAEDFIYHRPVLQKEVIELLKPKAGLLILDGMAPQLGTFVLPGNNFHVYDYALFWGAVRRDAERRLAAWQR